jgi:hypothetical protein
MSTFQAVATATARASGVGSIFASASSFAIDVASAVTVANVRLSSFTSTTSASPRSGSNVRDPATVDAKDFRS